MACSKDQLLTNQLDFEEDLTCSICLELYNDPVSLPCQHNFCRACLHSHLQQKSDVHVHVLGTQHGRFPCPNCRDYVDADINNLPKNFALQNIIHKFQSLKMENDAKETGIEETDCMHHNKPLMVYCDTCEEALCVECLPKRSHENHTIVNFKDKVKMYQEDVKQTVLPQLIKLQESLNEMKKRLTENRQETQELLLINMKDVTESFQELRSAVNQKESEIMFVFESKKEEVDSRCKTHTDRLDEQLDTLEGLTTKLSTISFQDPAKTIQEIKSDKERCEAASQEESTTSETIKQHLDQELDVSKQMHGLNDDLKRIMSEVNSMEVGKRGDNETETESTADFQHSREQNAAASPLSTSDTKTQERRMVKIVDPKTGKDISSEIYNGRGRTPVHYQKDKEESPFHTDQPRRREQSYPPLTPCDTPVWNIIDQAREAQMSAMRPVFLPKEQPQTGSLFPDEEREASFLFRRSKKQKPKEKKKKYLGFNFD